MPAPKLKLKAIKCTQCGGSVELRGGHKVKSIVCQYCGTCMDAKDEFKALYKFENRKKPFSPLKIGKKAKLRGVNYIVIGIIQYEQREDGEVYRWLEYLLFSQTHGYVWLCLEDGHWTLIHEVKDLPDQPVAISMPRKSSFTVRGKTFKTFECSSAAITYVEGELTWQAKKNEKIRYLDAICPPYLYSIEKRGVEQEYFWGEYIPHSEIEEAFKVEVYAPVGVYSCQPSNVSPIFAGIGKGAMVAAIISLLAYFLISSNGTTVLSDTLSSKVFADGAASKVFRVNKPNTLYGIKLRVLGLKNQWAYYDIKATDKKGDTKYFQMPSSVSYYEGYEGGEYWSEGSTEVTGYFKIPDKGEFKLSLEGEGGSGESPSSSFRHSTRLILTKGARLGHYTLLWFFICLALSTIYIIRITTFESQRWNDGDEEDDD